MHATHGPETATSLIGAIIMLIGTISAALGALYYLLNLLRFGHEVARKANPACNDFRPRRLAQARWAKSVWQAEYRVTTDGALEPCSSGTFLEVNRRTGIAIIRGLPNGAIKFHCEAISQDRKTYIGIAKCAETGATIDDKATIKRTADNKLRMEIRPSEDSVAPTMVIFRRLASEGRKAIRKPRRPPAVPNPRVPGADPGRRAR